jgi:tetratricopeptide (TPR) repeat protein
MALNATHSNRATQFAAVLALGLFLVVAAYSAVDLEAYLLASNGVHEDIARAMQLSPWNSAYALNCARSETEDSGALLRQAVRLSPYNAAAWMDIGMRFELAGDHTAAERALLEAAQRDRTFQPAWTLANYYCRRQNLREFATWMRRAAAMSYDDPKPLFELCRRASDDQKFILDEALPSSGRILRSYLEYLIARNLWEDAAPAADRLSAAAGRIDAPVLLAYCDVVLEAGRPAAHLLPSTRRVWNSLCERKILPYAPIDEHRGSITNSTFSNPTVNHAFDWRIIPNLQGVDQVPTGPGWQITLNGKQAEQCVFLMQFIPSVAAARYQLRIRMTTSGLAEQSGIAWRATDAISGTSIAVAPQQAGVFNFQATSALVRLSLEYHRVPGTVRAEGTASIQDLQLVKLP